MQLRLPAGVPVIDCWNKADAAGVPAPAAGLTLSARTGAGLDALRQELLRLAGWQNTAEGLYIARARHLQALQGVAAHLTQAEAELASSSPAPWASSRSWAAEPSICRPRISPRPRSSRTRGWLLAKSCSASSR